MEETKQTGTVGTAVPMKGNVNLQRKLTFGEAIEKGLKQGKGIFREGWHKKGMFVFRQEPSIVPAEIIPKMSSLPESIKNEFVKRKEIGWGGLNYNAGIGYKNQLVLVFPDNTVQGWTASPADILEEDWLILD